MKDKKIKTITVNLSIPKEVLDKFDEIARSQHWGRSTFWRLAAEYYIVTHYLEKSSKSK